jgi:hypothetical protein
MIRGEKMRLSSILSALLLVAGIGTLGIPVAAQPKDSVDSSRSALAGPTLTELCKQHPTDKCAFHHNYVVIYEMLFSPLRNQKLRLLEIGVLEGDSLRLWAAYFPSAQIFGIDIQDKSKHDTPRIKTLIADQGKRADLANMIAATGGNFDIVLDDGGHVMAQQQISFAVLFSALKSGGLYIIEDIHTSFPDLYPGYGVERGGANSTYSLIDRFVRTGRVQSEYLTQAENNRLTESISHCMYFWRPTKLHSDFFACWRK